MIISIRRQVPCVIRSRRRLVRLSVGGIPTINDTSSLQDKISTTHPSYYNTFDINRRRPFSSKIRDDDLFDLPPLDLTTPSTSIPLPPNMVELKRGPSISDFLKDETDNTIDKQEKLLDVMKYETATTATTDLPPLDLSKSTDMLSKAVNDINRMSYNQLLNNKKNTVDQSSGSGKRGKLHSALTNVNGNDEPVSEVVSMSTAEKKAILLSTRNDAINRAVELYPISGLSPKITHGKRLEWQTKMNNKIKEIEQKWLNGKISHSKFVGNLFNITKDLRALEEYGIKTGNINWKRLRKNLSKEEYKLKTEEYLTRLRNEWIQEEKGLNKSIGKSIDMQSSSTKIIPRTVVQPPTQQSPLVITAPLSSQQGPTFSDDVITTQANGTILGYSGSTSILCTVVLAQDDISFDSEKKTQYNNDESSTAPHKLLQSAIEQANAQSGATFVPLQVDYRERYHAAGKIPTNMRRRDNTGQLSDKEVLAARVIDRTLRPWLLNGLADAAEPSNSTFPDNIVVNCEVQSYDPSPDSTTTERTHTDPTALAINSTIAALYQSAYSNPNSNLPIPLEAAACVKLAILRDGTAIFDPTPSELKECKLELLYAGTRDKVLMLEFSVNGGLPNVVEDPGVAESTVADAIKLAHEAIIPIIDQQEELNEKYKQQAEARELTNDESLMTDDEVAKLLGLTRIQSSEMSHAPNSIQDGTTILEQANAFVWSKVGNVALKLFGCSEEEDDESESSLASASIHQCDLLPKKVRGRRENIMQGEIVRLLRDEFTPDDTELAKFYRSAIDGNSECLVSLSNHIHESVMKQAMDEASSRHLRADGRRGLNVVRPVSIMAPILPDSVHGSAVFSRGETQVLCTASVGAPKEGLPQVGPFLYSDEGSKVLKADDDKVPVGSLRFLRSQAEMESDLNSRRIVAGKEMTGDSGIISEVKRAFLHYDFPDFSTGVVKRGGSANRRAIGHGNLAEKAILPVLPHPQDFPYTIRLTSEVTSSNGSSSMASACGSSLCLMDAGVPIVSPVAGVSVGLSPGDSTNELLLDITGTEDHYGSMDFKICGTYAGVTAMQLDVKRPLDMNVIIDALYLAKEGRCVILDAMAIQPRPSLKETAPRVEIVRFDPNRKRDLVGPGGAVLRQLEDRFNVSLDLSQEGQCLIFGPLSSVSKAKNVIMDLVSDVEEGGVYEGTVIEIKDFGAVIELLRNKEGLLHVSELTDDVVDKHPGGNLGLVSDHLRVGDKIEVLCTKIDPVQGSIRLSRKKLLRMRKNNVASYSPTSVNQQPGTPPPPLNGLSKPPLIPNRIQPTSFDNEEDEEEDNHINIDNDLSEDQEQEAVIISIDGVDVSPEDEDSDFSDDDTDDIENDKYDDSDTDKDVPSNHPSSHEALWEQRLNQLIEYKEEKSNTNVPVRTKTLGSWVKRQRELFKKGELSDDRINRLNEVGFQFEGKRGGVPKDLQWEQHFDELVAYTEEKGNTKVPRTLGKLGSWVRRQRQSFKDGAMTEERVNKLNELGFEWTINKKRKG